MEITNVERNIIDEIDFQYGTGHGIPIGNLIETWRTYYGSGNNLNTHAGRYFFDDLCNMVGKSGFIVDK